MKILIKLTHVPASLYPLIPLMETYQDLATSNSKDMLSAVKESGLLQMGMQV